MLVWSVKSVLAAFMAGAICLTVEIRVGESTLHVDEQYFGISIIRLR